MFESVHLVLLYHKSAEISTECAAAGKGAAMRLLFFSARVIIERMMQQSKYSAVFDLDGTLIDSMEIWREVDEEFFARRGMAVPETYQQDIAHLGSVECAKYTVERYFPHEKESDIIGEWSVLSREKYAAKDAAKYFKPGALEFLRRLHGCGVKLAVATASSEDVFMPVLRAGGAAELFGCFATVEEAGRNKSFPDIFCLAAQKLGVRAEECVVFEDNLLALRAAGSIGMRTAGVFDEASRGQLEQLRREADFYIPSFEQVPPSLCALLCGK